MTYGIGYMGSKSKIADWVLKYIPNADNFYDLFCGGCAMTHAAMLSNKFKNFYINDIQGDVPQLFVDAINGKYHNENRWISRENFFKLKDTDAFVRCIWSFGNNGSSYIYGKNIEKIKYAFYASMYKNNCNLLEEYGVNIPIDILNMYPTRDKYLKIKKIVKSIIGRLNLQHFEALNRLRNLESLKRKPLLYKGSYKDVQIQEDSIIYCDIPYKNTEKYMCEEFNYNEFYNWCLLQTNLVIISEYNMPKEKFICIAEKEVKSTLPSKSNPIKAIEKLFIPKHQEDFYRELMSKQYIF